MKISLIVTAVLCAAGFARAEVVTYAIDPSHTSVMYEVNHFGTSTNRGRFDKKEGTVQIDKAAKTGKVEVTFETASVNTGVAQLNTHLQSKEFLSSSEFPTAKFVGDKFSFDGDKVSQVSGMLTLAGKTNPVTLKATNFNCYTSPMLKREVCGGDFETTISRDQWGINYGLAMGMKPDVKLLIQVEAIKQQ